MNYLMETKVLDHGFVKLVDTMPRLRTGLPPSVTRPGDQRIVAAARVSIAGGEVRPTSDDRKLIRYLVKNKHTTPLEQVRFTFHCRMPLFVARQWIRHRTGSFNEESARYGKLAGDFYVPSHERLLKGGQAKKNKQGSGTEVSKDTADWFQQAVEEHADTAYRLYEALLEDGLARELARMVLPLNIYTQWYWTTDLHNLMHFLRLRLHSHAQWEFRQYAEAILPMAEALAPYAMEAFKETLEPHGAHRILEPMVTKSMSDGMNDARRAGDLVGAVETAALGLGDALRATGDRAFYRVHPEAIQYANDMLKDTGYRLVKID